jgi:hypothetical protein
MSTEMIQLIGLGISGLGALIFLVGWIWLIVIGFQKGGALWGILNIVCQPLTGLIFCITQKTGWLQWGILVIGYLIMCGGLVPLIPSIMREF